MTIFVPSFQTCNYSGLDRYFRSRKLQVLPLRNDTSLIPRIDTVILPGVGTFAEGMAFLDAEQLRMKIAEFVRREGRLIGICLGMQLLFSKSDESKGIEGLGVISGKCLKLPASNLAKVPRIGWDEVYVKQRTKMCEVTLNGEYRQGFSRSNADYYFVHSYYCKPDYTDCISAFFYHGEVEYCAAVQLDNVYGFQFHPEKSGSAGYRLLDSVVLT